MLSVIRKETKLIMYWKPFLDTAYQLENKQGDIEQLLVGNGLGRTL